MKNITNILILLLFCSIVVFGKNRELHIPTYKDGTASYSYKSNRELSEQIKLQSVQNTESDFYFRLWTDRQVIDIWGEPTKQMSGTITSWTEERNPADQEKTGNIFYKTALLDSNRISNILKIIDSLSINEIPDSDLIEGLNSVSDVAVYIIETANKSDYFFKTYLSPTSKDSLKEIIIIQYFIDETSKLANASEYWDEFEIVIPYDCYSNGGIITCISSEDDNNKLNDEE